MCHRHHWLSIQRRNALHGTFRLFNKSYITVDGLRDQATISSVTLNGCSGPHLRTGMVDRSPHCSRSAAGLLVPKFWAIYIILPIEGIKVKLFFLLVIHIKQTKLSISQAVIIHTLVMLTAKW